MRPISNSSKCSKFLNASVGNCEILFCPIFSCLNESKPSTEYWFKFVIWHPFKFNVVNFFRFLNGDPDKLEMSFPSKFKMDKCGVNVKASEGISLKKLFFKFSSCKAVFSNTFLGKSSSLLCDKSRTWRLGDDRNNLALKLSIWLLDKSRFRSLNKPEK